MIPFGKTLAYLSPPVALAAAACILFTGGEGVAGALRFERTAVIAGEWWRLVSAHLVHDGARHLVINLAALALAWAVVGTAWRPAVWWAVLAVCAPAIGTGLWAMVPSVDAYVGLSGLLHALVAAGAVGMWRRWRAGTVILVVFLAAKSVAEAAGITPGGGWAGVAVIAEAHWLGSASGFAAGLAMRAWPNGYNPGSDQPGRT